MAKSQVTLRVRHKVSKLERDMTEASWKNLKRHWEVIGVLDEDGNVNPTQPQQESQPKSQGSDAVAIGKVEQKEEPDLLIGGLNQTEETDDQSGSDEATDEDPGSETTQGDQESESTGSEPEQAQETAPEQVKEQAPTPAKPAPKSKAKPTHTETENPAASRKSTAVRKK